MAIKQIIDVHGVIGFAWFVSETDHAGCRFLGMVEEHDLAVSLHLCQKRGEYLSVEIRFRRYQMCI